MKELTATSPRVCWAQRHIATLARYQTQIHSPSSQSTSRIEPHFGQLPADRNRHWITFRIHTHAATGMM